jgi:uncharacterized integral membrane protein
MAIAVFVILLVFVSFNLENKCDISFGFDKIQDVPVFLTIFFSFVLGFFGTLPFVLRAGSKRKRSPKYDIKPEAKIPPPVEKDAKINDGGSDVK